VLGLGYLIVFGSVVAFSAYTWLLERRSATFVATHTFVNPVVAVLLGWLVARELLTPRIIGATGLILAAVLLLNSDTSRRPVTHADRPEIDIRRSPRVVRTE
jgi:drug/metabolite transporter (DMT)-like permease